MLLRIISGKREEIRGRPVSSGKEFSGLQLLAYMYSAFQVIDPFLDTGMSFKKEYEMAREMFVKREGK